MEKKREILGPPPFGGPTPPFEPPPFEPPPFPTHTSTSKHTKKPKQLISKNPNKLTPKNQNLYIQLKTLTLAKVGLAKVGLAKVGLAKVGLAKVGLAKVGLAKVGRDNDGQSRFGQSRFRPNSLLGPTIPPEETKPVTKYPLEVPPFSSVSREI